MYKNIIEISNVVDISRCIVNNITSWEEYTHCQEYYEYTGIKYILQTVEKYLKKISNNYFFEYSILPSVLDPRNLDKLVCISYLKGDEVFRSRFLENISQTSLYEKAIYDSLNRDSIAVYHHPNFLFDIGYYKTHKGNLKKTNNYINITYEFNNCKKQRIRGKSLAYIKSLMMDRAFSDVIKCSQQYYSRLNKNQKFDNILKVQQKIHNNIEHNNNIENINSCFVSFPIIGSLSSNQLDKYRISNNLDSKHIPLQGIGSFFLYFEINDEFFETTNNYKTTLQNRMYKLFDKVGELIRLYSINYIFNLGLQLQDKARKESIKSAKAAIMSRNMSHNLGSHVMAYLKQHLNSVQDIISANVLSQLFLDSENIESIIKDPNVWLQRLKNLCGAEDNSKQLKEIALPFLVGLGRFISYLQERQDFIATIATDYIPYYSGVNFKDFIYDELNPDLRFERHRERAGLQPDNILLGNIARSEGLGRTTSPTLDKSSVLHDIVLYFRDFNGHQIVENAPGSAFPKSSLDAMRQYVFSLPGGVVGRQALFSILENVIRNAAKHGDWRNSSEKCLEIKFDIFCKTDFDRLDKSPDTFNEEEKKRLKAFLPVYRTYYEQAQGIEDLYIITLTDNLSVSEKNLIKLREAITEPYVRDSGEMINANKGIKEMRISASWLRSLEDDIENHPYTITPKEGTGWSKEKPWTGKAPVLLADIVKEKETKTEGALRYIFCVMRQKKIALITERKATIIQRYRKQLLQNSWDVYTFEEYKRPATNKSYEFIVMDVYRQDETGKEANYIQKEYDELRRISPNRLYKSDILEGRDIIEMLLQDTEQAFKYFDHILKDLYRKIADVGKEDIISISDDKTSKKYQQEPYPNKLVEIGDGDCKINKYLYKKHFEAKSEFDSFMKLQPAQCLFVEGITGNNSTDRLIRNESIDELWIYRHLHTIKSKVAVFDERLFSKIFKIDESDIHAYRSPVSLPQIEDCPEGDDAEEYFISCSLNIGQKIDEYLKNDPKEEQIFEAISDIEQLRDYIDSHESWFSNSPNKILKADYRSIVYNMKGIDAFTILKTGKSIFGIYGYCGYIQEDEYFGRCGKIGSIHLENGKFVVQNEMKDFMGQNRNPMKYDYLTIHQGLLDKIYEEFGIKDNAQSKHAFSQAFYAAFSATPEDIIDYEDRLQDGEKEEVFTGFFLPRLFIHSGRSKPAPRDMPQKQPFIQYAAIEHAVLDCKYSLIELLDSARYE